MPSINVEDYLKNIYELQADGRVTTNSLAEQMGVSAPSVTDMMKKLSDRGLLTHTPYRGVELSEAGRKAALHIIRRHRLWEMFLVKVLHFSWDEIHEEAEKFEHIMSERMEEKIDAVLGHPSFDPHGAPIPDKRGAIRTVRCTSLNEMPEAVLLRVIRVEDEDPALLQSATTLGIGLDTELTIEGRAERGKKLKIVMGRKRRAISSRLAECIFVEKI